MSIHDTIPAGVFCNKTNSASSFSRVLARFPLSSRDVRSQSRQSRGEWHAAFGIERLHEKLTRRKHNLPRDALADALSREDHLQTA
jgi:hypothetical protein